jgi:glyoxylase-like metal-dependent hydrolase (beta-lactamase superfamily II)
MLRSLQSPLPDGRRWQIGNVTVTCFIELESIGGKEWLLPQATPEAIRRLDRLHPDFADADGRIKMSIHSFLIETPSRRILVDTGIGNDKQNRRFAVWNDRKGPFLENLVAAGCPIATIDTVVCTHLHADHVGWNTLLVDGRWVPTFARARYLMGRREFDFAKGDRASGRNAVFDDSIRPIAEAGLLDLVSAGDRICDELGLVATPGHSPGHLSVQITSAGEEALLIGDVVHHPCQMAHPDWSTTVDFDPTQAARTRHALFAQFAGTPVHILGGHFVGGPIARDGEAYRIVM